MTRPWLAFSIVLAAGCAFAQSETKNFPDTINTITTPPQLRRIEPPPPNMSEAQLELRADVLRAEKFYADSVDYYQAAIHKSSDPAQLYNKEGISELLMLHYNEAKHMFQHAMKYDRHYPEATNNLGVVYYNERNYGRAIKYYRKAIELNDASASFHSNLGTAYFAKKKYDKATKEYATALSLDPEIFDRRSQSGVTAHMSSPEDRARYEYVLAKMFATRGDADHCLLYLKKAMEEGYKVQENFQKDREFAGFRKDPRFITLLQNAPAPLPN